MKIGVVLDNDFDNDMRVKNEVQSLVNAGHDVEVLCFDFGKTPATNYEGAKLRRITASKILIDKLKALNNTYINLYPLYWYQYINSFVKTFQPDVLHVHDLWMAEAALRIKKTHRLPIVIDLHENYAEAIGYYRFAKRLPGRLLISQKRWRNSERKWLPQFDRIIVVIDEAKERLVNMGIPPQCISVVPNYVKIDEFTINDISIISPDLQKKLKDRYVLCYVGAFDAHRGLDMPIKAMPKVLNFIPNALLLLVGWGKNAKELKLLVDRLDLSDSVIFTGYKPNKEVPYYINVSNVCLIPHYKTPHTDATIPHKLFQYMLMKKPVLVSNCAPLDRIVRETNAGLSYVHDDVNHFVKSLLKIYKTQDIINYGENGYRAVLEKYNWKIAQYELINLYKELEKKYYRKFIT